VPRCDIPRLSEALEFFVCNPSVIQGMGPESRKIAADKFDVNQVNHNLLKYMGMQ
jgi:hypothetical protein